MFAAILAALRALPLLLDAIKSLSSMIQKHSEELQAARIDSYEKAALEAKTPEDKKRAVEKLQKAISGL